MMDYLAHSAQNGSPSQSYKDHVQNVVSHAGINARAAAWSVDGKTRYAELDAEVLTACVSDAAEWHDLGKLDADNQAVLHGQSHKDLLPYPHADAGAAALLSLPEGRGELAALMVHSHHRGLPDLPAESLYEGTFLRDKNQAVRKKTDAELEALIRLHSAITTHPKPTGTELAAAGDPGVFCRISLSCLVDADHTDTAAHYGKYPKNAASPLLRPAERLNRLDEYISRLGRESERNKLRSELYHACREASVPAQIAACDSPVGTGKTTAIMAHLLAQAVKRNARRVFVILPFTNIISQSVSVYREALVLPGEDPTDVVAELHYRADFDSEAENSCQYRAYSAQWRAPIIVTTAVAFFETLAANRPSGLRRLHELPGSVIFVDEAHAALPVRLLPLAWRWMQSLADEWNCYWLLASGSLVEFWNLEDISESKRTVPQIVSSPLRTRLACFENRRIRYSYEKESLSPKELIAAVTAAPGPRLLIVNMVQSAAFLANLLNASYRQRSTANPYTGKVMHLSTALSAEDRERTVQAVQDRLKNDPDKDWTLVATSCVEAGVDFSFRSGFREIASLLSLVQTAGRINRNGEYPDAELRSFFLQESETVTANPGLQKSQAVLFDFFKENRPITPDLSTEAIRKELEISVEISKALLQSEEAGNYAEVGENFHVIENDTVLVVADEELKHAMRFGQASWKDIQRKAVSIRRKKVDAYHLPELIEGVYNWNLRYDGFLGVMAGVLDVEQSKNGFLDK